MQRRSVDIHRSQLVAKGRGALVEPAHPWDTPNHRLKTLGFEDSLKHFHGLLHLFHCAK